MSEHDPDPHAEFRRQAARHFNRPPEPPRIFRDESSDATKSAPPAAEPVAPSADRFAAGTTYTGPGVRSSPPPGPAAAQQNPVLPTTPPSPSPPPPPPPPPWSSETPAAPVQSNGNLAISPANALWGVTALCLVGSLMLGFGWVLLAAGAGAAAYYSQVHNVQWPPDLQDLLARRRSARPATTTASPEAHQPVAVIPFRPLTFPEIFSGSFRVLTRHWPTLVGIPSAILLTFSLAFFVVLWVLSTVVTASMSVSMSMFDGGGLTQMFSGLMGLMIALSIVLLVVAFPTDALLLGLSVIAADRAVRGKPVVATSVLADARGNMLAVCRLTLCYYGLFFLVESLVTAVVVAVMVVAPPLGILFMVGAFAVTLGVNVMFSLAPVVLIVERRGAIDSMKRALQLSRPAAARLIGIHLLWGVCGTAVLLVPGMLAGFVLGGLGAGLFLIVALATMIAYFRTLQMLIYTDLRIRQERLDLELAADWARNAR